MTGLGWSLDVAPTECAGKPRAEWQPWLGWLVAHGASDAWTAREGRVGAGQEAAQPIRTFGWWDVGASGGGAVRGASLGFGGQRSPAGAACVRRNGRVWRGRGEGGAQAGWAPHRDGAELHHLRGVQGRPRGAPPGER